MAEAVLRLKLSHVVVTSPTRDDLPDGGAAHFAATVAAIRERSPSTAVELLVPDFGGDQCALETVLAARPAILAHNLETVPRLYAVRQGPITGVRCGCWNGLRELQTLCRPNQGSCWGWGRLRVKC